MHNQDERMREHFTMGGTTMGAEADEAVGGSQLERRTWGMIGGAFGVAGRGNYKVCQLVVSSNGKPCARITLSDNGTLLRWEPLC